MKTASSRTLAAAQRSAGSSAGVGAKASRYSMMAPLSHSVPCSVRRKGTLPSGEAFNKSSGLWPGLTRSSMKGRPFSSRTNLTLLT